MATIDELGGITRSLNAVKTAGAARVAVGQALIALGKTYPLTAGFPDDRAQSARRELDSCRTALESWFKTIPTTAGATYVNEWAKKRSLVERAYVVIAGVEGQASYVPRTSHLEILTQSLAEAKANIQDAVGAVTDTAGRAAGGLLGGALSGIGFGPLVLVGIVIVVVLALRKNVLGSVLGKVVPT